MEIKVTGTPDEIKKLLNAVIGSKEQLVSGKDGYSTKVLNKMARNINYPR